MIYDIFFSFYLSFFQAYTRIESILVAFIVKDIILHFKAS